MKNAQAFLVNINFIHKFGQLVYKKAIGSILYFFR
jgi:hypothetical protein